MQYLYNEQHYIDRYDLHTIEQCLETIDLFRKVYQDSLTKEEVKDVPKEEKEKTLNLMLGWQLLSVKGRRYERKKQTIQEWMTSDKLKQDKQDYTPPPKNILCPLCSGSMSFNTSKHLEYEYDSPIMRMMFLFKCNKCEKQQWIYDDGEIRVSKPDLCPKCNEELVINNSRKGKVITTLYTCKGCKYTNKEILDLSKSDKEHKKWQDEQKKKEEEGKKLLEKYREEFCLSDKEGIEHVETLEALEVANVVFEEEKQKYDDKAYQVAINLKKINVPQLEKLLVEALEKETYVKFTFDKPDMGRYVTISFTVLDANSTRRQNVSEDTLKKLIKTTLENTNWRLMSDGVHYRLGYLSGTLKAYETEEELLELAGANKEVKQPISKLDPEKRQKYMGNNLVQIARISGEYEGIENTRKRRLEKEPDGFFLKDGKDSYSCGLCGRGAYGEDMWWNLDGLRCRNCRRNIVEGVIPPVKDKYDDDKTYIQQWQIQDDFGVHPATRSKLERQGILKPRHLKDEKGSVYYTIYLISENKEFLKKYPRKDKKIRMSIVDDKGNKIEL